MIRYKHIYPANKIHMSRSIYISAFIALVVLLAGVGTVDAQSTNRLQNLFDRVNELQAQLQNDQSSNVANSGQTTNCSSFKQDLFFGDSGKAVKNLQEFLNGNGFPVANTGPGSPGQETTYFGPATMQAVKEYQRQFSNKILLPAGLGKASGYWGPQSQQKAEELCSDDADSDKDEKNTDNQTDSQSGELERFTSAEEFKSYLQASGSGSSASAFQAGVAREASPRALDATADARSLSSQSMDASQQPKSGDQPNRFSQTNVQEQGIDEPDILKTDGEHVFFADKFDRYSREPRLDQPNEDVARPQAQSDVYRPPNKESERLRIIDALPADEMSEVTSTTEAGDLLLAGDDLVVLSDQKLVGVDVSDPTDPEKQWEETLGDDQRIETARLKDGQIQLVTRNRTNRNQPCPVPLQPNSISVRCDDIAHPQFPVNAETTYHVSTVAPDDGNFDHKLSFVGSDEATIYVADEGMYIGYTEQAQRTDIILPALQQVDSISDDLVKQLEDVIDLNISQRAKYTEIEEILSSFKESLSDDERLALENDMENAFRDYVENNKRNLTTTHLLEIDVSAGSVVERGEVPGTLLNQFSLDAESGYLRLATTVGESFGPDQSANDVYVLDDDLDITGSVKGLGLDERIYSARFMEDTAYVVTFRQIDPFYVLDLSDPDNPEMRGEVKLPGFSSYLHPLPGDRVIGIGEENNQVKATLFDVSDKDNPEVLSSYIFDEYQSNAVENHHAFLADREHNVVFVPGQSGGYILSYENDELTLQKAVANIQAKRALYIDDTMYVVGENSIVAVDETDWTRTNKIEF